MQNWVTSAKANMKSVTAVYFCLQCHTAFASERLSLVHLAGGG
jgi:hypothetical protein